MSSEVMNPVQGLIVLVKNSMDIRRIIEGDENIKIMHSKIESEIASSTAINSTVASSGLKK